MRIILCGGGTAGHINPAIAVANLLKERHPDAKFLFIGAEGHMEEKLVPQAGFELICLPGSGLSRKLNLAVVTNLLPSTGIALPFFSYGGTALAVNLGEMGIILSISRGRDQIKKQEVIL